MSPANPHATWPPPLPLVAILRGLQPARAAEIGDVLFDAGFRALEVPLNRPGAIEAIDARQIQLAAWRALAQEELPS